MKLNYDIIAYSVNYFKSLKIESMLNIYHMKRNIFVIFLEFPHKIKKSF